MNEKQKLTKVALFGKSLNESQIDIFIDLFKELNKQNLEIFVNSTINELIINNINFSQQKTIVYDINTSIHKKVDFFISIGGDGTFLEMIKYVKDSEKPVIGINTGKLGFLASISKENISKSIESIVNKDFTLEKRSLIKFENAPPEIYGYALNEITIYKSESSSMITVHAYLDDEFLNSYWADGLIISTPTGSTAYSLSAGGPIVVPDSNNFIITPIAPHNLNVRPIVINDKKKIQLKVSGRSKKFMISTDSQTINLNMETNITLYKSDFYINLIKMKNNNFFSTLHTKLFWGIDKRN
jgi:NAD+ kinase